MMYVVKYVKLKKNINYIKVEVDNKIIFYININ